MIQDNTQLHNIEICLGFGVFFFFFINGHDFTKEVYQNIDFIYNEFNIFKNEYLNKMLKNKYIYIEKILNVLFYIDINDLY